MTIRKTNGIFLNPQIIMKKVGAQIRKHSPEILTGIGIAGMVVTTVLAVRATPEAMRRIEIKKKEESNKKLTVAQTVQAAGKYYSPAIATGAASIACIIGASTVNKRRNVALATAYSLAETSLRNYRDRVIEAIGEKEEQTILRKMDSDSVHKKKTQDVANVEIANIQHGELKCCDIAFDRYFYSDRCEIERALNEINKRMTYGGETYVSLNEFYGELGLKPMEIGDMIGWNINQGMLDIEFDSHLLNGQQPILVMRYSRPPVYEYFNS